MGGGAGGSNHELHHRHRALGSDTLAKLRTALCGIRPPREPGDAHLIRNAGGIPTDDVLRSLALSQRNLGTREVVIVHHGQEYRLRITKSDKLILTK